MNRSALAFALLFSAICVSSAWAQAGKPAAASQTKPATAAAGTTAPAAQAKWTPPIKGLAHIEVIQAPPKKVGNEILTVLKVKNVSTGPIALLRADQLWYAKARPTDQITGDSQSIRRPFNPGEVVEITFHAPFPPKEKGEVGQSQYMFSHVNGKVDAKAVKKFSE
jgi:hypothetical protein